MIEFKGNVNFQKCFGEMKEVFCFHLKRKVKRLLL